MQNGYGVLDPLHAVLAPHRQQLSANARAVPVRKFRTAPADFPVHGRLVGDGGVTQTAQHDGKPGKGAAYLTLPAQAAAESDRQSGEIALRQIEQVSESHRHALRAVEAFFFQFSGPLDPSGQVRFIHSDNF